MVQQTTNSEYYLNELKDNPIDNNRYISVDNIVGDLSTNDNKWFFNLNFYLFYDGNLPINLLLASIETPFVYVGNLTLVNNSHLTFDNGIVHPEYWHGYSLTFTIDTANANLFSQKLTDFNMYLHFGFDVNYDCLNNGSMELTNVIRDGFVKNWILNHEVINFSYSNLIRLNDDNGWINHNETFYLDAKHGSHVEDRLIFYKQNMSCQEMNEPLIDLLQIKSQEPIVINAISYKFYYCIGLNPTIKKLEYIDDEKRYVHNTYDVQFNQNTAYVDKDQTIVTSLIGTKGFFIPTDATGYYEVQLQIEHKNNIRNYQFNHSFSFINEQTKNNTITIKQIYIDQLNNFERLEF